MFFCNRSGKLLLCVIISCIIYFVGSYLCTITTERVIQENEQNKNGSLHFLVDR